MRKATILACALCLSFMAYARSVSNVQAVLNESGDKVIITYQLDEKSKIEVYFSPTGLDEDYVRLYQGLTGAKGVGVSKGKKKTIEWNPSLDGYRSFVRDEVRFKVVAKAPTDNASELFSGFKPQKSDNASEHHEGESDIIPLVYVPQGDVPNYDIIVKPDSIANADSKVTLVINSNYRYDPSVDVKAILPDGHEVALDIAFEMIERKIRWEDGNTGESRLETMRFRSRNPHIVLGQFCQDGITKLIVNIHDPRKVITITKEIRTLRVKQAFNTLTQSELVFSKQHEREKIEFNKIYRWEKLTKNFDRTKIIRGLRINNTKSSDNNLYFSRQSGINLNGKTSMECKEEAQGYAFYTMVNTGFKTADGKYTGIISYLPQHNYDQPFANGYDEWQGIGLNMPIVLQQKKDANNYEFYFVEDEVYWGGVEKSNLEIEGIEVYVYDKAATEAEYAKRLDAYNKQQEKIRKEREERIEKLTNQVVGRWYYEDRYGGVTFVFWAGGQFDFCTYGQKTRGSYSIWPNGEIHIRCGGENLVTYMESANKMRIIEGGNGEVYTKISDQPYQP